MRPHQAVVVGQVGFLGVGLIDSGMIDSDVESVSGCPSDLISYHETSLHEAPH